LRGSCEQFSKEEKKEDDEGEEAVLVVMVGVIDWSKQREK